MLGGVCGMYRVPRDFGGIPGAVVNWRDPVVHVPDSVRVKSHPSDAYEAARIAFAHRPVAKSLLLPIGAVFGEAVFGLLEAGAKPLLLPPHCAHGEQCP